VIIGNSGAGKSALGSRAPPRFAVHRQIVCATAV
jgi:hypothetical protein